ncbi:5-methyltetrahydrofolate--homocysteine methyltransferase, partial [hydrothermal vent metagenome]
EPHLDKAGGKPRGSIVLATVKGDVHDIGKNLVDIILSNNGYTVHNIGIKQPLHAIIEKWQETGADAIGLSGLLVKSVHVMEENLREMVDLGHRVPVILGGAALSRHYAEDHLRSVYGGLLYYGKDAFEGLRFMDLLATDTLDTLDTEIGERLGKRANAERVIAESNAKRNASAQAAAATNSPKSTTVAAVSALPARSAVATDIAIPAPPFWGSRVVEHVELDSIYPFINTVALFRGQWQFKKGKLSDEEYQAALAETIEPVFARLKTELREQEILQPKVVYGYWPCASEGNDLIVYEHDGLDTTPPTAVKASDLTEVLRFSFPRQSGRKHLCISDFFRPVESGQVDVLALHCVTMGSAVSELTRKLFEANDYTEYLYTHGMGVETAEALAELWHKRIRQELGIAGDDSPKVRELFTQHYRGSRYSPGYPACPEMRDQEK